MIRFKHKEDKYKDAFMIGDSRDFKEFLDYIRKDEGMNIKDFSEKIMGLNYNQGYAYFKGRRGKNLDLITYIVNNMGFELVLIPEVLIDEMMQNGGLKDDKKRKEITSQNE